MDKGPQSALRHGCGLFMVERAGGPAQKLAIFFLEAGFCGSCSFGGFDRTDNWRDGASGWNSGNARLLGPAGSDRLFRMGDALPHSRVHRKRRHLSCLQIDEPTVIGQRSSPEELR